MLEVHLSFLSLKQLMTLANGMPLGCGLMYKNVRITTLSNYDDLVALCEMYMIPGGDEIDLTTKFVNETSSSLSRIRNIQGSASRESGVAMLV